METDPELPNLERLIGIITAPGRPAINLDGMRLPLLHDQAEDDLASDTITAVMREVQWRAARGPEAQRKRIYPGRYRRFRLEASYRSASRAPTPS